MSEIKTKKYALVINGLQESIDQVDKLKKQLEELDTRIQALSDKTIKINVDAPQASVAQTTTTTTSSSSSRSGNNSGLSEEEKLLKQINDLEQKRTAYQSELYQGYLANKELLKETLEDQKQLAASERMQAGQYSNTMQGMKQELSDIKQVMQTVDLGDTEKFKQLTDRANELNKKLLEVEKSYGQFGRNVGNYPDATEGINNLVIAVGGVDREFRDAREASRALSNELKTMAINGQQDTKEFKELQKTVLTLNSAIKDATVSSSAMDNMLDTMQSLTAMASVGQGIGAFFGMDNDKIEESIKKLVALQNVLQGVEKIQQQIKSGEFLGGVLSKANSQIDSFVEKMMGANKATQTLAQATTSAATATNQGATASKAMTAAQTAQATATRGTTLATKALSVVLKSIGIGLVIAAISALITYWEEIYNWITDTIPALKNLGQWFNKLVPILSGVGTALLKWIVAPIKLAARVIAAVINGDFKSLPKIVADSLKDSYNVVENYQKGHQKAVENQQEKHLKKMRDKQLKANEEAEKDAEAKYGRDYKRTQKYYKDQIALLDENLKKTKKGSKQYEEIEKQRRDYQRKIWESERSEREAANKKRLADSKKSAKEIADAENELVKLKIENMKEGLRKTITQLEEERKARLAKVRQNGHMTRELEAEINKLYDTKIEEEKKKHAENVQKIYDDMWRNILSSQIKYQQKHSNVIKSFGEQHQNQLKEGSNKLFDQGISTYGIQGKEQYSKRTQNTLGFKTQDVSLLQGYDIGGMTEDYKKLVDMERQYLIAKNNMKTAEYTVNEELKKLEKERVSITEESYNARKKYLENELELDKIVLDTKKKAYDDYYIDLVGKYHTELQQAQAKYVQEQLLEEGYSSSLATMFDHRLSVVELYWKERITTEKEDAEELYNSVLEDARLKHQDELETEDKAWNDQVKLQSDWAEKKKEQINQQAKDEKWSQKELDIELNNIDEEYNKASEELYKVHKKNLQVIDKEYDNKKIELENEKNDKLKRTNAEYYQESLQEFRDFQTALSNLANKQPVMNAFGIVNLKQTNINNNKLKESYDELARQIQQKRQQLSKDFKDGLIDKDVYQSSVRELDTFVADLGEKMDEVEYQLSFGGQWEMMAQGINQWVQMVGQGISQVMSSLSEITQNQYERQIAMQEENIKKYEELLKKQEDITKDHADKVNEIEDELKTARGDRRQQLIDNLNAEMAAQRASLSQQKKIEKEKEKAEARKKDLENEQARAKQRADLAQAYINMAMAISMAAVNKWPVPAIPMMAMASAAGLAQIAAIKSQNVDKYGNGGVIQGKSHSQGGVKVLGGTAEVEGGEFITNKLTTSNNVELLEFINTKKKRVNLDDMLEFYVGKHSNVKRVISSVSPKTKFADGGQIPMLRDDINISNRLLNTMEAYANRPVYVAVTEIEDAQANVNYVRALSGLEN